MTALFRFLTMVLAAMSLASLAEAHEVRPGFLEAVETQPSSYDVTLKLPVRSGRPLAVSPGFPADCVEGDRADALNTDGILVSNFRLDCTAPLQGRHLGLSGLEATITDIIVRLESLDGESQMFRATPEHPGITFQDSPSRLGIAHTYFWLGVEHILFGLDHLLFVAALVLLISNVRRLIETITAFTAAHSLTLVGTTLGWLALPPAPVEAVIALSILFLAHEVASKQAGTERLSERRPWLVAGAFGLLHGFGFAGALSQIGLPDGEIPLALAAFNFGVEAGQLIFVAALLGLLILASRLRSRTSLEHIASYGIGISATVWLFERLA